MSVIDLGEVRRVQAEADAERVLAPLARTMTTLDALGSYLRTYAAGTRRMHEIADWLEQRVEERRHGRRHPH